MAAAGGRSDLSSGPPAALTSGRVQGPIRKLPPAVANAIAAGEVIERPASVVKELLENSLDAGAGKITVEMEGGGTQRIRVVDDGRGMPPSELALALERHATSKLTAIDDLLRIETFGFRGEALASIAAVARVVVVTREAQAAAGARLDSRDQHSGQVSLVAAPPGTSVAVEALFSDIPARRAFLRSPRAEAAACLRVVSETALGRPEVRFETRTGGRILLSTPGDGNLVEAARAIFGRGVAEQLIEVNWEGDGISVVGVLGPPGVARPNRNSLVLMVNGRRVHQRALAAAVEGAYRGLIEVGRHPLAVLDLQCDRTAVDVNVHPTKREVRFREENRAFEAVQHACWGALRNLAPANLLVMSAGSEQPLRTEVAWSAVGEAVNSETSDPLDLYGDQLALGDQANPLAGADRWRYLGQAHNRYLVVETEQGLALLDQHAAHEKVLYRRILETLAGESGPGSQVAQGLLSPMLLEVGPSVVAGAIEAAELLQRAGFDLQPFGAGTLRCSAVPTGTRLSELEQLLEEVLGEEALGAVDWPTRQHRLAASVACHSAVRFGDRLGPDEVATLLQDLATTAGGITCPHGRPAVLLLSEGQLRSAFRRH